VSALHDPAQALRLVQMLAGLAVALSALEALCLFRERRPGGFYAWRPEHSPGAPRLLYGEPGFTALCALRLTLALLLAADALRGPLLGAALFTLVGLGVLVHDRLRHGTTGADLMMGIVLGGLALGSLRPDDPAVQRGVLWFVALQAVVTYASTGLTKLRVPAWKDGTYLASVFVSGTMGHRLGARLTRDPRLARALCHAVIAFECAFPLALLTGEWGALAFCAAALVFHLTIASMMGLKMFVLIFGSTYPAIVACALDVQRWMGW
jgi:hypothetical protein